MARFKPGQSGNPAGKPPGAVSERTKLMRDAAPDILRGVINKARAGDLQAAAIILDRVVPRLKTAAEPVVMADLPSDATLTFKAQAVADAVLQGQLDPVIGSQLLTALSGVARIVELDELQDRITHLEAARHGR